MPSDKEFMCEFIEMYRSFPCLWKIKSKEYSDRNLKAQAYDVLVEMLRTRDPQSNRETVVKKINSLRTAYRKELKKVMQSEKSGAGEEDVYKPHLWYFDQLHFIRDQEIQRPTISNVEDSQNTDNEIFFEDTRSPTNFDFSTPNSPLSPTPSSSSSSRAISKPRGTKNKCDEVLEVIGKRLAQTPPVPDKFTTMAATWAFKLKELSPEQAVHAEKLINDVFYEAQLGNLDRQCSLHTSLFEPIITYEGDTSAKETTAGFFSSFREGNELP